MVSEEESDRDPGEWMEKIEAGETALRFLAPTWKGPEFVGRTEEEGELLMWPVGMDYKIGETDREQVVSDLEDSSIDVETIDFSETPLTQGGEDDE